MSKQESILQTIAEHEASDLRRELQSREVLLSDEAWQVLGDVANGRGGWDEEWVRDFIAEDYVEALS